LTKHLFEALPGQLQGRGATAQAILCDRWAVVQSGDMVIVKGSNASRMSAIVDALKQRAATDNLAGAVKC